MFCKKKKKQADGTCMFFVEHESMCHLFFFNVKYKSGLEECIEVDQSKT